ncbi:hypothetical protein M433DRAFT_157530 [Acidomyces richmondensis BFW]|nr:hypothetical protein M433DRAFT_157530 [Acidomyces richmondensis BFW]
MSKKQFKAPASSHRVAGWFGSGTNNTVFGSTQPSLLSYIQEPPNFSGISNANAVVSFKNLSKRDNTTKAKALEELHTYVADGAEIDDSFLELWVKFYPRLSIDNFRRVRQLSHALNGQVCSNSGKKVAKHLPRIAGPWLAGTHDSDRAVAKAAHDSIDLVFPSPEKIATLKAKFNAPILEYCRDAILRETVKTLSDERIVTAEDAEATYARVVATSIAVFMAQLRDLPIAEVEKQQHIYDEVLSSPKLWEFATYPDASVRRAFHGFVQCALRTKPELIQSHVKSVSTAYIYKGLPSNQTGSANEFVQTIISLTQHFPSIWLDSYSGKKSPISRLKQFLRHGSWSGNAQFWQLLINLFSEIPDAILPHAYDDANSLLMAARDGVSSKEERLNSSASWPAYYALVTRLLNMLPVEDRETLLQHCVMPIIRQYLQPSPETAGWTIVGGKVANLVANAGKIPGIAEILALESSHLSDHVIEVAKQTQPVEGKEFEKSQQQIALIGERWAALQREAIPFLPENARDAFVAANVKILEECMQVLHQCDGKNFGAAVIIENIVRHVEDDSLRDERITSTMAKLLKANNCNWVLWVSSGQHLIYALYSMHREPFFVDIFSTAVTRALAVEGPKDTKDKMIVSFFPGNVPKEAIKAAKGDSKLQDFFNISCNSPLTKETGEFLLELYRIGALADPIETRVLDVIGSALADVFNEKELLVTLNLLSETTDDFLKKVAITCGNGLLLPDLLRLEEHTNEDIAHKAANIASRISSASSTDSVEATFSPVLKDLERLSLRSLSADLLQDLANRLLGPERTVKNPQDTIPSIDIWTGAVNAALRPPEPSLAILSPLGGAVHLVHSDLTAPRKKVQTDSAGLSQALRIAMYISALFTETDIMVRLKEVSDIYWDVIALLYITVLLAEDNLSIVGVNALWDPSKLVTAEPVVLDFITQANSLFNKCWQTVSMSLKSAGDTGKTSISDYDQLFRSFDKLTQPHAAGSPMHYYHALAHAKIHASLFELYGHNTDQVRKSETTLRDARASNDTLAIVGCVVGLQQPLGVSQGLSRFCNELVAELTGLGASDHQQKLKYLERLIELNAILSSKEDAVEAVAKQRVIFLVKSLLRELNDGPNPAILAEIYKTLTFLLPGIQDMYGEHWPQIVDRTVNLWKTMHSSNEHPSFDEGQILLENASLKLFTILRKLSQAEGANEDLVDALKDNDSQIREGLAELLKSASDCPDESHQPLLLTHELLAREISCMSWQPLKDADELYALLYAPSRPIRRAAFDLLHKHIPADQEQISLNVALDNNKAHLPDELLSVITEAPNLESPIDASFYGSIPSPLQGYLYGWLLLFDHFNGSSHRVQNDYVEQLKEGSYLSSLLQFSFDFLGHSRGEPVNASKFSIQEYIPDAEPVPERDVQWLLIHLYYLTLVHLPILAKNYYLNVQARQTSKAIESWTEKHISPLVIEYSLKSVAEWVDKSVKDNPEYEKMSVKIAMQSKEVNVSYMIDEQIMAIKIELPGAYPLASARAIGVNRVAVKEEKWRSWLHNCQGVIKFSNGSIIDGLSAWRRNVIGALKGQTECAICYSIIDSLKELPTKRCGVCRNLFHSGCLYKWFKTSNASTCPLCRNPFNFN